MLRVCFSRWLGAPRISSRVDFCHCCLVSFHYQPQPLGGKLCERSSFTTNPNPWTGAPPRFPSPQGLLPRLAVSAPCSRQAYVGRRWVFPPMLLLNWQRTFDGATPRLSRPTYAWGEHGADTASRGNRPCGLGNRRGAPVQGLRLVVIGDFYSHDLPFSITSVVDWAVSGDRCGRRPGLFGWRCWRFGG